MLLLFVLFCSCLATNYPLSLKLKTTIETGEKFVLLRGPLVFHEPISISVYIGVDVDNVHVVWMSETQYRYANSFSPPSSSYPTHCFPPSTERGLIPNRQPSLVLKMNKPVPGRYYLVGVLCNSKSTTQTVQFDGKMVVITTEKPSRDFSIERFRWWISTAFVLQFLLYGFTLYAISIENQRPFWAPYGFIITTKTVLILLETLLVWSVVFNFELYLAEIFSTIRAIWRAFAIPFVLWVCFGSYFQGSMYKLHWLVLPVLCGVGSSASLVQALCFIFPFECSSFRLYSTFGVILSCWIPSLYIVLGHLRLNKEVLDGRNGHAPNYEEESMKRGALRVVRSALYLALLLYGLSLAVQVGGIADDRSVLLEDLLMDSAFWVVLVCFLITLVANFQSNRFVHLRPHRAILWIVNLFPRNDNNDDPAGVVDVVAVAPPLEEEVEEVEEVEEEVLEENHNNNNTSNEEEEDYTQNHEEDSPLIN